MENMTHAQFWKKLIKYNLLALVFIALTEFAFITYFAKHYMTIDVNIIKKAVIDNIVKI